MTYRKAFNAVFIGSVSLGSWYLGSYVEREKILSKLDSNIQQNLNLKQYPALPIFGTVSAASVVPYSSKVELTNTSRVSQIMKHGFPGLDNVRSFEDYVLSYDRRNKVAHWVFEHLTKDNTKHNDEVDRSKCDFMPDESIHPYFRSQNTDYKHSGYDRGHLAAAGNHKANQKHVEQTFFLSNMAPQVGKGFNRNSWNRLEKYVRKLTKVYKDVYCCTGPLYLPRKENDGKTYIKYEVIGANHVAVPTHFFKVIVGETVEGKFEMEAYVMPNQVIDDNTPLNVFQVIVGETVEGKFEMEAYVMPNQVIDDNTPLNVFQVPPESIERAAGLLFFSNLTRNNLNKINGKKC